ncbi:unnamed protein product [Cuscuta campestris]|uniref:Uncharacterized protein n=1 Tax=Cuscuta campestris TaxID=132261 RepID=A0A484KL97_9ASTE|nr:unnamed protein product [Cuscuta campestris]
MNEQPIVRRRECGGTLLDPFQVGGQCSVNERPEVLQQNRRKGQSSSFQKRAVAQAYLDALRDGPQPSERRRRSQDVSGDEPRVGLRLAHGPRHQLRRVRRLVVEYRQRIARPLCDRREHEVRERRRVRHPVRRAGGAERLRVALQLPAVRRQEQRVRVGPVPEPLQRRDDGSELEAADGGLAGGVRQQIPQLPPLLRNGGPQRGQSRRS